MFCIYDYTIQTISNSDNVYLIDKPSVLANIYSEDRFRVSKLEYLCESREESIARYRHYFDIMYSGNKCFREAVDELYDLYKNGEDVYLATDDRGETCHGDVIKEKLQQRLLRERLNSEKEKQLEK